MQLSAREEKSQVGGMVALSVALIAAATLAGAWFFQLGLGLQPCELCLKQRYAYYAVVVLGALLGLGASRGLPRSVVEAGLVVMALALLGNAVLGGYHAGVEWHWWAGPSTCTGSVNDFGSAGNLLSQLDTVKVVLCDTVQWRFLGLSLAGYNVLISLGLAIIALWGARSVQSRAG
jgi:disulfide bond formation protein DsbB